MRIWKTIKIDNDVWRTLSIMKIDGEYKNISDVILHLIQGGKDGMDKTIRTADNDGKGNQ
jgi:predicted CopG family antitoxin